MISSYNGTPKTWQHVNKSNYQTTNNKYILALPIASKLWCLLLVLNRGWCIPSRKMIQARGKLFIKMGMRSLLFVLGFPGVIGIWRLRIVRVRLLCMILGAGSFIGVMLGIRDYVSTLHSWMITPDLYHMAVMDLQSCIDFSHKQLTKSNNIKNSKYAIAKHCITRSTSVNIPLSSSSHLQVH